jgi:capsular polysaccharide biosynthesis protein
VNQFKFYFWLFSRELWNKKWVFLPLFWLFSIFAIIVVFAIPDQYKTRAGLYIDTDQLLAQVLKDTAFVIDKSAQSQARKVRQMIYSTASLRKVLRSVSAENYNLTPTEEALKLEAMAKNLKFGSYNAASKDYYEISYVHQDPVIAYNTLRKILDLFIETNIRQMSSKNDRALSVSEDTLKVRQKELAQAQADLAKFKQENIHLTETTGVLFGELQRLKELVRKYPTQSNLLQSKLTNLSALLAQTSNRIGGSRTNNINSACDFSDIEKQLASAQSRGLTSLHPDVVYYSDLLSRKKIACSASSASEEIVKRGILNPAYVQLSEQVLIIKSDLQNLKSEYISGKKRVIELEDMLNKRPVIMEKLRILETRREKASRGLKDATSNSDILQGTIDLSQKSGLISYEVIEEVQMPVIPEKPNRLLLFVGAFLGALIAAISYILVKFQLEQRMSTIGHVREAFDLPILGSVTYMNKLTDKNNIFDTAIWFMGLISLIALYGILIQIIVFSPIRLNFEFFANLINKILQLSI